MKSGRIFTRQKYQYNYICKTDLYVIEIQKARSHINIVSIPFNASFILHHTTLIFQLFRSSYPMVLILSIVLHSRRRVRGTYIYMYVCIYFNTYLYSCIQHF